MIDITFPHFHNVVAISLQVLDLLDGRLIKFVHGLVADQIHGIAGVISRSPIPETALDFIGCVFFVPVEEIATDTFLAAVALC